MQHWYSAQFRQYRLQFIRAFSNFYVKTGRGGPSNTEELIRVPCNYGDPSRIAASIVRGNSENKVLSVPFISCYVSNLTMNASRRQDPQLVQSIQVNERKYNDELGRYTNEIGNRYTVERHMPVPYDLTMQVDIWSNNLDTKEQILEQILVLYNPAIDIQTSVNPLDWTVLSIIEMQDNITWSSRSIPMGTENPIDVASLVFKMPVWLNPPAKVKKQSIIHQIVTNIVEGQYDPRGMYWDEYEMMARTITTPDNATIQVSPRGDGSYDLSLCDSGLDPIDKNNLSTVVTGRQYPQLSPGMSFRLNGITCTIQNSTINEAVADIRRSLTDPNLNCIVYNDTTLQLIDGLGRDIVLEDLLPGTLASLGIASGTHLGGKLAWWRLLGQYGAIKSYETHGSTASQIRLKTIEDIDQTNTDIVGWFSFDPLDQNILIWTPDPQSFPASTLADIDAIIDPSISGPNINLPPASIGQRYLLTEDISVDSVAWGPVSASADDIIVFDGTRWKTAWVARGNQDGSQYVNNSRSGRVYRWINGYWSALIDKKYLQGYWRLSL